MIYSPGSKATTLDSFGDVYPVREIAGEWYDSQNLSGAECCAVMLGPFSSDLFQFRTVIMWGALFAPVEHLRGQRPMKTVVRESVTRGHSHLIPECVLTLFGNPFILVSVPWYWNFFTVRNVDRTSHMIGQTSLNTNPTHSHRYTVYIKKSLY